MRSTQVYRALDQVPNRFALCSRIARGVRTLHRKGGSMRSTVAMAFEEVESPEGPKAVEQPVLVLLQAVERVIPIEAVLLKPVLVVR